MSIASPYSGILNFKTIPVDCTKCEYYGNLTDLPDEAKRALIDSTVFHNLEEERLILIQMRGKSFLELCRRYWHLRL